VLREMSTREERASNEHARRKIGPGA
jgi:hypothetical protein